MTFSTRGLYASSSKYPRNRRGWLLLGAVVAAVLLVVGVLNAVSGIPLSEEEERHDEFADTAKLVVDNDTGGQVEVKPVEGDKVTLDRDLRGSPLVRPEGNVDKKGQTVRAEAGCGGSVPFFGTCWVTYEIGVPDGTEVKVNTAHGEVDIEGTTGSLTLSSNSGEVNAENVTGDVSASTSSGSIEMEGVNGDLDLESSAGSITADSFDGDAKAQTSSGSVELSEFDATDIQAKTSSGNVSVDGTFETADLSASSGSLRAETKDPFKRLVAESSSGAVDIRVPENGDYDLTGDSSSGQRDIDVGDGDAFSAKIGVDTSSGGVSIRGS